MSDGQNQALLPPGLSDALPPQAEAEGLVVQQLLETFGSFGYRRVKPPLVEFEEGLLSGTGKAVAGKTMRLMDPQSGKMLGLRADITPQVGRIATSRLAQEPRPLRMSYAGQVVRTSGNQLRPERQFTQAGFELIGAEADAADVEVILLAIEAIRATGIEEISVDVTLPDLVPSLCRELGMAEAEAKAARDALDAKDIAALGTWDGETGRLLRGLFDAVGEAGPAIEALKALNLPGVAAERVAHLAAVVEGVKAAGLDVLLTVDPGEYRGYKYQSGIGFSLFSRAVQGELGRGGRYEIESSSGVNETAVGFSVFLDTVMKALPSKTDVDIVFIPYGTPYAKAKEVRKSAVYTMMGLEDAGDAVAEAKRLGCNLIFMNDKTVPVV